MKWSKAYFILIPLLAVAIGFVLVLLFYFILALNYANPQKYATEYETNLSSIVIELISDSLDSVGWEHKFPETIKKNLERRYGNEYYEAWQFYYFPEKSTETTKYPEEVYKVDTRNMIIRSVSRGNNIMFELEDEEEIIKKRFEDEILPIIEREALKKGWPKSRIYIKRSP